MSRFFLVLSLVIFLFYGHPSRVEGADTFVLDDFDAGLSPQWQSEKFKGLTDYQVVELAGEKFLRAECAVTASALVLNKKYLLRAYPYLSWRWKIAHILAAGDAHYKARDDYAARIYVVFPHWFFPKTRSINYIWANRLAKGSLFASKYAANSVMMAVQSGDEKVGQWVRERQNVYEDYWRIFGEEPPPVGAIAIMTDGDDTGGHALAWYDDLRLESR